MSNGKIIYFPKTFVITNEKREELLLKQVHINMYFKKLKERCSDEYEYLMQKNKVHASLIRSIKLVKK